MITSRGTWDLTNGQWARIEPLLPTGIKHEHGGLTDQAIDPDEDPLEAIPAEEFQRVWRR
jgi:transposase